ncbi:MAG: hypothetical protein CFE21_05995 [Bacteroidetes bacterium B1(2017)]|nr:MAG: hypothetical protein CFE21_05995 [Bacteroidetes bacterium B1(2017)]
MVQIFGIGFSQLVDISSIFLDKYRCIDIYLLIGGNGLGRGSVRMGGVKTERESERVLNLCFCFCFCFFPPFFNLQRISYGCEVVSGKVEANIKANS